MAKGALEKVLGKLVRVERGEMPALLWSCAYFFFLLASYYVIRPLRDEMGVSGGGEHLNLLFLGTLAGTLAANPIFGALVARYPRRVFVPIVYRFLIVNLLAFFALLTWLEGEARLAVARAFFVWASVFNLFAVSVFWGVMADLFRSEQGKRLFGFIGAGGTAGGIAGAALTAGLAEAIGPARVLLVSALLLEAATRSVKRLAKLAGADAPAGAVAREGKPPGEGALTGLRLVFTSPYLLAICLFLFFHSVSATFLYFEQARIVRESFRDAGARTAFFARVDLYVNVLTALAQCFLTGRIVLALGVGATLCALPLVVQGGFFWLGLAPVASVVMAFQVIRRAVEYGVVKPAREVLFTVVSRQEKYTSKSFIDTFVHRCGDAVGAGADVLLSRLGVGQAALAAALLPLTSAWVANSLWLGRRLARRAAAMAVRV